MNEKKQIKALQNGDTAALSSIIDEYNAFAGAIVYHIIGSAMPRQDCEEVVADAFFTLWKNAQNILPGKLKPYLASIVRSKARDKLRRRGMELPLEEETLICTDDAWVETLDKKMQARLIRETLLSMSQPDRDIFIRHYYYCQTVSTIAEEMRLNPSTIKTKLRRGRERLKQQMQERGIFCED